MTRTHHRRLLAVLLEVKLHHWLATGKTDTVASRGDPTSITTQERAMSYSNFGAVHPGRMSGGPSLTRSGNWAGRFCRNAVIPSVASADWPR